MIFRLLFAFTIVLSGYCFAQFTTAHSGEIADITSNDTIIATAGVDGRVKLTEDGFVSIRELYVSADPLANLVLHPSETLIAVETKTQKAISVFNTQSGRKLYDFVSKDNELITHFSFSPQGRYLVLSSDTGGLYQLQARSGIVVQVHRSLRNVDFFMVGKSTKNVLTYYRDTGTIAYYNFHNGAHIQSLTSRKGLERLLPLSTRYFIGAFQDKKLVLLDVSTGTHTELYNTGNTIVSFTVDPDTNTVYIIERNASSHTLIILPLAPSKQIRSTLFPFTPTKIYYTKERSVYVSESTGRLYAFDPARRNFSLVLDHHHSPIERFSFSSENEIRAVCKRNLVMASFDPGDRVLTPKKIRYTSTNAGTLFFSSMMAYTYPQNNYPHFFTLPSLPFDASVNTVEQLEVYDDVFLYRTQADTVVLQTKTTGEVSFSFSAPGLNDTSYIQDQNLIIIAQPDIGILGTPLLAVHSKTRETIPIQSDQFLSYDVHYDARKKLLYSLGLERTEDASIHTTVEIHDANFLQFYWKGLELHSEQLQASLASIDDSLALVGHGDAQVRWYDKTTIAHDLSVRLRHYSTVYASPGFIAALRKDGSIVIINKKYSEQMISIYCNRSSSRWELASQESEWLYPFRD